MCNERPCPGHIVIRDGHVHGSYIDRDATRDEVRPVIERLKVRWAGLLDRLAQ